MSDLADILEQKRDDLLTQYTEMRGHIAPSSDIRRKTDACEAVTHDIVKIILERISSIDGDFDAEREGKRLHGLLKHDYARSIYGSTAASNHSQSSSTSCLAVKRADAAADLAVKEAQYRAVQEEERQKERIKALEEEHMKQMAIQISELERLRAEKEVEAARARLEAYSQELSQLDDIKSVKSEQVSPEYSPRKTAPPFTLPAPTAPPSVNQLAQAVQDSIKMNRLPTPEPTMFSGEPIKFIEWKSTFTSLIEQNGISAADKLYYLKRYATGPARKCLEGTFFRNDEEAYRDAWKKMNQRYGQPFVIQKAVREKLSNWPKIQSKDADGLRDFADFVNACMLAMPHVKGLQILNDCEENQKLLRKLPDWINARWNRHVTKTLMECVYMHISIPVISHTPVMSVFGLLRIHAPSRNRDTQKTRS
ncbi:AMME syndrome candidate gene 1 protein isoform X1 [Boleophthalmus pectinirostris]|uniref:AMME syndrome candidate gene 1 protein isoform X1 n=1 Tax=Boleophthalmus pectinirostris TaxID=150288 RepID=UPI00242B2C82|nr:AMME syndrome candidate gene 1 protein isoform X1 [Boleophthalmus pectinirostris]XP_055004475.1 AMME syndrome candidate gene 1 protein isoform X1 [Boleophthalmus pectinirostris]